jgi:hypothetical protein
MATDLIEWRFPGKRRMPSHGSSDKPSYTIRLPVFSTLEKHSCSPLAISIYHLRPMIIVTSLRGA